MSFSIFDKMNKIVFENRFFNFFTKETFKQGKDIIIQENKINKVFFIMEGQFEIMTNLSLFKIYSLLHKKTKRKFDFEKMKAKFPKEEYNLRLYISYNRDILGLEDSCLENDISFITAKCLSDKGCAFTIEKTILNEIRHKIPEIDKNINIIKAKREKVMIDRLANIYNRIIQTRNKNKEVKFNENDKSQDSFNYLNYFFGINQGDRNSNAIKISTIISSQNRVKSAILTTNERRYFNEEDLTNCNNYINSKYYNQTKNFDNSNISSFVQKEISSSKPPIKSKNSQKGRNKNDNSLKDKISEFIDSPLNKIQSINEDLLIQSSNKMNGISNNNSPEKVKSVYNSHNKNLINENKNLFSKIDNIKTVNKRTIQVTKRNSKSLSNKIFDRRNSSDKYFLSFKKKESKMSSKPRPFSNYNNNKISLKKVADSISRNLSNFNSYFDRESKISKVPFYTSGKRRIDKKRTSRVLSPDLENPTKIRGKLNLEKYLKRILGTRYKEQYISYEEQKFNKLIESYELQKEFLNKSKKAKLKLKPNLFKNN